MDVTMIGLQNAGKTSLLRVLSVRIPADSKDGPVISNEILCQGGEFTIE